MRGNNAHSVRELVAAGAGLSVFPCFVGDSDPRLVRVAAPIRELETDQWIVTHHEERHSPPVRKVGRPDRRPDAGAPAAVPRRDADPLGRV